MEYIYTALNLATQTDDFYLICIIVALALLVRAAIGFGDGLLAVPLLAMLIELKEAVALILFLSTTISVYPLWKDRHHLQFDSLKRTSTAALLAIPLGVLLLGVANEQIMKGFLGALLTSLSFWKLKSVKNIQLQSKYWSYFFGVLAGILGAAYGLRGIVFSLYAGFRGWGPGKFKSTINGFYLLSGVLIPVTYYSTGLITQRLVGLYIVMFPVAILTSLLGHGLTDKLNAEIFQKIVWISLLIIGMLLLTHVAII